MKFILLYNIKLQHIFQLTKFLTNFTKKKENYPIAGIIL